MEVAQLTAQLRMEIAGFLRNADQADAEIESIRKELSKLEDDAQAAGASLKAVGMRPGQATGVDTDLRRIRDSLDDIRKSAIGLDVALNDVGFSPAHVAGFVAEAGIMRAAVESIGDEADRTSRRMDGVTERTRVTALESMLTGRPMFGTNAMGGPRFVASQGGAPGTDLVLRSQIQQDTERMFQDVLLTRDGRFGGLPRLPFPPGATPSFGSEFGTGFTGSGLAPDRTEGIAAAERYLAARDRRYVTRDGSHYFDGDAFLRRLFRIKDDPNAKDGGGGRGGGRGGGGGGSGLFRGLLPGGARAGPAALGLLAALGIAAGPQLVAAAGGLGFAGFSAMGTAAGAFGAVKMAGVSDVFKGVSDQQAYMNLSAEQKQTADLLRQIDAGLGQHLTGIAQQGLLPGLRSGLRSALTPNTTQMLSQTTGAFSGAVGGAAADWGKFLGSSGFSDQFGEMMRRDAGYVGDLSKNIQRLFDSVVRMTNSGHGFVDWLDKVSTKGIAAIDVWAKSTKGQQEMAHASDLAKQGLTEVWHVLGGLFDVVVSFEHVLGGLSILNLISEALHGIATFVNQNRDSLKHFFEGAQQSVHDLFALIHALSPVLHDLLTVVDLVATHIGGWRSAIDGLAIIWVARWLVMKTTTAAAAGEMETALEPVLITLRSIDTTLAGLGPAALEGAAGADAALTGIGGAAAGAATEVGALEGMLAGLAAMGPIAIAIALQFVPPNTKGQTELNNMGQGWLGKLPLGAGHLMQWVGDARHAVKSALGYQYPPSSYTVDPTTKQVMSGMQQNPTFAPVLPAKGQTLVFQGGQWINPATGFPVPNQQAAWNAWRSSRPAGHGFDNPHEHSVVRVQTQKAAPPLAPQSGFDKTGPGSFGLLPADVQSQIQSAQFSFYQAQASGNKPDEISAAQNLVATYKASLTMLQSMHLDGANALKQKQEETALERAIASTSNKIRTLQKGGSTGGFDPLSVGQHQSISQAQQALAQAQTTGDTQTEIQAAQGLMQAYQDALKAVRAEHDVGKDRIKQLKEEATLAKDIASTHNEILRLQKETAKLTDLGQGPYLTSANAQIALSFGYKPRGVDFLHDLRSQINQERDFLYGLHKLAREGAPQNLISTLQAGGVGANGRLVHELATSPVSLLHEYEKLFAQRVKQVAVQNMVVTAKTVNVGGKPVGVVSNETHNHFHGHTVTDAQARQKARRSKFVAVHRSR